MRKKLLILWLLSLSSYAWAQQFKATGVLYDFTNSEAISTYGGEVSIGMPYVIISSDKGYRTDGSGNPTNRKDYNYSILKYNGSAWELDSDLINQQAGVTDEEFERNLEYLNNDRFYANRGTIVNDDLIIVKRPIQSQTRLSNSNHTYLEESSELGYVFQKQTNGDWLLAGSLPQVTHTDDGVDNAIAELRLDMVGDILVMYVKYKEYISGTERDDELYVFQAQRQVGSVSWVMKSKVELQTWYDKVDPSYPNQLLRLYTRNQFGFDGETIVLSMQELSGDPGIVGGLTKKSGLEFFQVSELGELSLLKRELLDITGFDDSLISDLYLSDGILALPTDLFLSGSVSSQVRIYENIGGNWVQGNDIPLNEYVNFDRLRIIDKNRIVFSEPGSNYREIEVDENTTVALRGNVFLYEKSTGGPWEKSQEITLNQADIKGLLPSGFHFFVFGESLTYSNGQLLVRASNSTKGVDNFFVFEDFSCGTITNEISESVCADGGYQLGANFYNQTGTYSETFKTTLGCDSTVVLSLTVLPELRTELTETVCDTDGFFIGDEYFGESGTYKKVLQSTLGCDSTVVLNLTVNPSNYVILDDIKLRQGQTVDFGGQTITETGEYKLNLQNQFGCDSTVVQPVLVSNDDYVYLDPIEICEGDEYPFGDQTLTETGVYVQNLKNTIGGDSIVSITLTVLESHFVQLDPVEICEGSTGSVYQFGNQAITESGDYEQLLTNQYGCDSLVAVSVTFREKDFVVLEEKNLCAGDIYTFVEMEVSKSGTYEQTFNNRFGCDSTVQVTVNFHEADFLDLGKVDICEGGSYTFGSRILTNSGDYQDVLINQYGCDSTVNVSLNVLDKPNPSITLDESNKDEPTLRAEPENAIYQWIDCATGQAVAGATGITFKPTVFGDYAVDVTVNGCTARSQCFSLQVLSAEEEIEISDRISVFPNPSQDIFQVELPTVYQHIKATIYNTQGVVQSTATFTNQHAFELSLAALPQGIYTLRIIADEDQGTKRILKQ